MMPLEPEKRREFTRDLLYAVADAVDELAASAPANVKLQGAVGRVRALLVRLREDRDPARMVEDPKGFGKAPDAAVVSAAEASQRVRPRATVPDFEKEWDREPMPDLRAMMKGAK